MKHNSFQIPAGCGKAFCLTKNQKIKLKNTFGEQVVDAWALNVDDITEFLSTHHTRSCLEKLAPKVGDHIYSNKRRSIMTLLEDTSPGIHDMLLSACDNERYRLLGHKGYHANCADNFINSLAALGYNLSYLPSPWNIFENVTISIGGMLKIAPPLVKAGDYIVLKAEIDLIVIFSACPMDIAPTNGLNGQITGVEFEII